MASEHEVALVDLAAQNAEAADEIERAVARIVATGAFVGGEEVEAFEREFAAYCGAGEAIGVGNGTDALLIALLAAGIGPGDEVVTVAHTFVATAEAIALAGATPIFVDVDPVTGCMDPQAFAAAVTSRTKAVVAVHLYGQPADMDEIVAVARRHGLLVVEDACQAHGARYKGRRAGSLGDVACFSFYPTKNLGAAGDAGAIVTSSPQLADAARLIRDHGSRAKYVHEVMGRNSRLDAIQAAVLRIKLRRLDRWNAARRMVAAVYGERFAGQVAISAPVTATGRDHVYHLYVVRSPERDALQRHLAAHGVGTGLHYPVPVHRQAPFLRDGQPTADLPETDRWAAQLLSIPMHPHLTPAEVEFVAGAVLGAVTGGSRNHGPSDAALVLEDECVSF